jgi:hypothetical protein
MKIYNPLILFDDCVINTNFIINSPESGFSFYLGNLNNDYFTTGFGFYGYSGFIFDHDNNFFGGYSSGVQFTLNCNLFDAEKRVSYFYNDVLMSNNLLYKNGSLVTNCIEFDKINNSTALISINDKIEIIQDLDSIADYNGIYLISSDNMLLRTLLL